MSDQEQASVERRETEDFVPRGAVAFMVFMILAYSAIWLFFYFVMIGRP